MQVAITPSSSLQGQLNLPASKSYSIRAFFVAACGGDSRLIAPSHCDDAVVARDVAQAMGAYIQKDENRFLVKVQKNAKLRSNIFVKESGTVLRFILPFAASRIGQYVIEGAGTLKGRPNKHLVESLRSLNVDVSGVGNNHSVPITIQSQGLTGGEIHIDGSVSSQFVSALLITAATLNQASDIFIDGQTLVSADYIKMTLLVLAASGIEIQRVNDRHYHIPGRQRFTGLKDFHVPSDLGLAAFHMVAALLIDSDVVLKGYIDPHWVQADGRIIELLQLMGANINVQSQQIKIKGPQVLSGGAFSLKACPDLVPIMTVAALFAKGPTTLKDIHHARVKESNRITDLREELMKVGAEIDEMDDAMIIQPLKTETIKSAQTLDPRHDHRLAMAFAVLGLKVPLNIKDIECTNKSYPDFVDDYLKMGGSLKSL